METPQANAANWLDRVIADSRSPANRSDLPQRRKLAYKLHTQ